MNNITKLVVSIIESDIVIKRSISRGIINKRALALYLMKEYKIKAPVNALISAIRRFESGPEKDVLKNAREVLANSTMISKNGVASLTLTKDGVVARILPKLFSVIEVEKQHSLRIIQADESVKVIIDKKNLLKVKKLIPGNRIIKISEDLAEININLDKKAWSTPGITAALTNELSLNNINIVEIMSCMPEIILFFKEKDLMPAYSVLYEMYNN